MLGGPIAGEFQKPKQTINHQMNQICRKKQLKQLSKS
jgi:hypothetical protein